LEDSGEQNVFVEDEAVTDVADAIEKASDKLLAGKEFTSECVRVRVTGAPHRLDIVDTPGIIQHHADPKYVDLVRDLIKQVIKNERAVIVVVSNANEDIETGQGFEFARDVDPSARRTIRVNTKCDVRESAERDAKICKAIVAASRSCNLEERSHADHFVIARDDHGEILETAAEVAKFEARFKLSDHSSSDLSARGVQNLSSRLDPILRELVTREVPKLLAELQVDQRRDEAALREVGEEDLSAEVILTRAMDALKDTAETIATKWRTVQESAIENAKLVMDTVVNDKEFMLSEMTKYLDPTEPPMFQGQQVFRTCMKMVREGYSIILDTLLEQVLDIVQSQVLTSITDSTQQMDEGFPASLRTVFHGFLAKARTDIRARFDDGLTLSGGFFTVNAHYIDEAAELSSPESATELAKYIHALGATEPPAMAFAIQSYFKSRAPRSIPEQVVGRVQKHLRLVAKAQFKHFCDTVNGSLKAWLKEGLIKWATTLPHDSTVRGSAKEKLKVLALRQGLKESIALYKSSCKLLYAAGARLEPGIAAASASASSAAPAPSDDRLEKFKSTFQSPKTVIEDPEKLAEQLLRLMPVPALIGTAVRWTLADIERALSDEGFAYSRDILTPAIVRLVDTPKAGARACSLKLELHGGELSVIVST